MSAFRYAVRAGPRQQPDGRERLSCGDESDVPAELMTMGWVDHPPSRAKKMMLHATQDHNPVAHSLHREIPHPGVIRKAGGAPRADVALVTTGPVIGEVR